MQIEKHYSVEKRKLFWDSNGNKTLSYNPESRNWKALSTEEKFAQVALETEKAIFYCNRG